jgi:hypothetical protein
MEENTTTKDTLIRKYGFSDADFEQISAMNISLDKIAGELLLFTSGIPKITLEKPATLNDGIVKLSHEEFQKFADFFDANKDTLKLKKFVPASGAASRMFKFLNEFLNEFDQENCALLLYT